MAVATAALAAMAVLPIAELVTRVLFHRGFPGSGPFTQHLTLWVAFLGAALAAREEKLLALGTGTFLPEGRWREVAKVFAALVSSAISVVLGRAGWELAMVERQAGTEVALGLPVWVVLLVLPVAFGLIALRLVWLSSPRWWERGIAALGIVIGLALGHWPGLLEGFPFWPLLILITAATFLGGPIFAALGGAGVLLFMIDGVPIAAVPAETYRLTVSPTLPAIPLFTLTGFILAESRASERLIGVFRALFGWIPGGTAVVTAAVCAFFTIFTGGSGVTILALGALLYQALLADGYREKFSIGLLTASGSLGLLLPPAMPLILYGIIAEVPIKDLFLGGIFPGLLLVGLIAAWGMREGVKTGAGRTSFAWRPALAATWHAKWELLLPVFLLVAIFSGIATLVEAAALSVLYVLVVAMVIHRDVSLTRDLPRALRECVILLGGVLIILGVAMGLTSYLVDAQVPSVMLDWVKDRIESPLVFLLCLNIFLLVVGCLMDIFSAIVVVVPLLVPLGVAFGIDPVHLGIIFIANLELGYLTPPVGLNLFLASYRFNKPLLEVYRAAVPWLIILGLGVLLITYLPVLTTGIFSFVPR